MIVNFLFMSFSIAASVLRAYPVVDLVARFTDAHTIKMWLTCSRFKALKKPHSMHMHSQQQIELLGGCPQT